MRVDREMSQRHGALLPTLVEKSAARSTRTLIIWGGLAGTVRWGQDEAMTKVSNISRRRRSAQSDGGADYVAKRTELLRIAARLFKEQGYQSTRLVDIAKEAGLDRATVYYYVGSKEE